MSPIRPEMRDQYERAAGRCECEGECGRGTHEGRCPNVHDGAAYSTGSRVVLTTAHRNHVPADVRDDNLFAACQGCHLHYDRQHHAETRSATIAARQAAAGQLTFP